MTPIRRQYLRIKQRYLDAILFFRLGDFYETFDEDATLAARELEIALTSRGMGKDLRVPMAGVPAHALDSYLARLIKRGYKVAICEQLSDPAESRGLVERDVVRVVTPGTVVEAALLEKGSNNYLAAVVVQGEEVGLASVDVTTGEFATTQMPLAQLGAELDRLAPSEVLMPQGWEPPFALPGATKTPLSATSFEHRRARERALEHFQVATLESFGCEHLPLATGAAGAILDYLATTQPQVLGQLTSLRTYTSAGYMTLDPQTRRNLELFQGGRWGDTRLSLLSVLDFTRTAMGARALRRWLGQPLYEMASLLRRQEAVEFFYRDMGRREETRTVLGRVADLERILTRVRLDKAGPRELLALKGSLEAAVTLAGVFNQKDASAITWLSYGADTLQGTADLIGRSISPEGAGEPGDGNSVKAGFSPELDELRSAAGNAREFIAGLEKKEREQTGIRSLKVGYNRVFGYYIEVSNAKQDQVPNHYQRRQTLVNGERFITPELKEYESLILNARERIEELERSLYRQVCAQVVAQGRAIALLAEAVTHLDVFSALAEAASRYRYVRPRLTEDRCLEVKEGRHPVVERALPPGAFVPNDVSLAPEQAQVMVLTGPNMSGKSTYIRQVALITLMAQIGSFVPADSATVGLVDRIFTRIGLQDDLATGQSTFMVEMVETAAILNQATPNSLVILDEIGRGTSTYDGLSIARAVVEHIHNSPKLGCKTLFATHYHELTDLAGVLPRVRNYQVAVSEEEGQVVFLHRILPGGADKSYGVHVAQLAGLPRAVTNRAWEVLKGLERDGAGPSVKSGPFSENTGVQMPLFDSTNLLAEELLKLDVSNMTPLEAINKLYELQNRAKEARN